MIFYIGLVLAAVGTALDIDSTNRVIEAGGREMNPIMAFFMRKFGDGWIYVRWGLCASSVLGTVFWNWFFDVDFFSWPLFATGAFWCWIAARNYGVLRDQRKARNRKAR
jgi:hypothetical protein